MNDSPIKNVDLICIVTNNSMPKCQWDLVYDMLSKWAKKNGGSNHVPIRLEMLKLFADDMFASCLSSIGKLKVFKMGKLVYQVDKIPCTLDEMTNFFESLDVKLCVNVIKNNEMSNDNYLWSCVRILRASTLGKPKSWIDFVKRQLFLLKRRCANHDECVDMLIRNNNNMAPLYILTQMTTPLDGRLIAHFETIVNNYLDKSIRIDYYEWFITLNDEQDGKKRKQEIAAIRPHNTHLNKCLLQAKFRQVLFLKFCKPRRQTECVMPSAMYSCIAKNPFSLLCFDKLADCFGHWFYADATIGLKQFDTCRDENDGTLSVVILDTCDAAITFTNQIMNHVLFYRRNFVDSDVIFLCLWYFLKYDKNCAQEYRECIAPMEAQLKVRFDKYCPLPNKNSELSKLFPKWCSIWYILHELPYLKQSDQASSCTLDYLNSVPVMCQFLADIYQVNVDKRVQDYLKTYKHIMDFAKFRAGTDPFDEAERIRRLRALKCNSIECKERIVYSSRASILMSLVPSRHLTERVPHSISGCSRTITIPFDEKDACTKDKRVQIWPGAHDVDESTFFDVIYLVYGSASDNHDDSSPRYYFEDTEENVRIINLGIEHVGFDARVFTPFWSSVDVEKRKIEDEQVCLHEHTLRPRVDGMVKWQQRAQTWLAVQERFVSPFAHLAHYVIECGTLPTFEQALLFIYQTELAKKCAIVLRKCADETDNWYDRRKIDRPVSTLPAHFYADLRECLDKFANVCKLYQMKHVQKILRASANVNRRIELEQMDNQKFLNWLNGC